MKIHNTSLESLREREQEVLTYLEQKSPEKITRTEPIDPEVTLNKIGIENLPPRPNGYIRYQAQDFIVEEEGKDATLATIEPEPAHSQEEDNPTIYADLVKIGMGTLEAVLQIANGLNVRKQNIGYAGIKDTQAITSQHISLRNTTWQNVTQLASKQLFLKPKHTGKGALSIGQLKGNKFTILIRTENQLSNETLHAATNEVAKNGFANFYGPQRFGGRLLNPQLGKLLCQGKQEEAIKLYLTAQGPFDTPLFQAIRHQAEQNYGDWPKMAKIFNTLPYSLRHERAVVETLQQYPNSWHRSINVIADQVRFWIYGYASYLINQRLSNLLGGKESLPDPLPIPLGGAYSDELYADELEQDNSKDYQKHLKGYTFLTHKERTITPWIMPTVHNTMALPQGAIISFTLPKAAYATTFLMFLFNLYEGMPIPHWVNTDPLDTKKTLGTGSSTAALEKLGVKSVE